MAEFITKDDSSMNTALLREALATGEGGLGAYVATLDDARRGRLEHHLRAAYLTGRPDGERSFVAVALSCRGLVPKT